jgi:anti-sigma factor RsiW
MNCPLLSDQTADLLLDYSAGRLDPTRAIPLEKHMDNCDRCAAFRLSQTEVWAALDAWEPEPVSVAFNRALWQKIDREVHAPWYRKLADQLRFGAWKPAFPLAAAALVVAAGFAFDHHGGATSKLAVNFPGNFASNQAVNPGVTSASLSEADQVEKTLDDLQLLRQLDAASKPI